MKIKKERILSFFIIVLGLLVLNLILLFYKTQILKEIITFREALFHTVVSLMLICINVVLYIKYYEQKYKFSRSILNLKNLPLFLLYFVIQVAVLCLAAVSVLQNTSFK